MNYFWSTVTRQQSFELHLVNSLVLTNEDLYLSNAVNIELQKFIQSHCEQFYLYCMEQTCQDNTLKRAYN